MFLKRSVALFVFAVLVCAGLFAQVPLEGDDINAQLRKYVRNISKLIPDSVTTQNIWSYLPRSNGGVLGGGINASFTFAGQSTGANIGEGFGGKDANISKFPDAIGFLPAVAFDVRGGARYFDIGLMGMWADSDAMEAFARIAVEGSHYIHRSIGFDFRVALLTDNIPRFFEIPIRFIPRLFVPSVTFQGGYFFTWMSLDFKSNNKENISMDFRNDAFFFSLQASKKFLDLVTPFIGFKTIFAKTFSEYSWDTGALINFRDLRYNEGLSYKSGTREGEFYTYLHLYGGVGVAILTLDATLGLSYNVISEHFSVSIAARYMFR